MVLRLEIPPHSPTTDFTPRITVMAWAAAAATPSTT